MSRTGRGHSEPGSPEPDEPPPFWRRWSRLYGLVAGLLAAETIGFWLLSRWAS